ncbi:MAG: hypothetical protein V8S57_02015 [Oscillospiraceae bacterium]
MYDYTQVLFAAALGFFVFGEVPDWLSVLGLCAHLRRGRRHVSL